MNPKRVALYVPRLDTGASGTGGSAPMNARVTFYDVDKRLRTVDVTVDGSGLTAAQLDAVARMKVAALVRQWCGRRQQIEHVLTVVLSETPAGT